MILTPKLHVLKKFIIVGSTKTPQREEHIMSRLSIDQTKVNELVNAVQRQLASFPTSLLIRRSYRPVQTDRDVVCSLCWVTRWYPLAEIRVEKGTGAIVLDLCDKGFLSGAKGRKLRELLGQYQRELHASAVKILVNGSAV